MSQRQQNAADLVRTVTLPELEKGIKHLYDNEANTPAARAAAALALVTIQPEVYLPRLAKSLADTNETVTLRERIACVLAGLNSPVARQAVLGALATAQHRLQVKLAQSLAASGPAHKRCRRWRRQISCLHKC